MTKVHAAPLIYKSRWLMFFASLSFIVIAALPKNAQAGASLHLDFPNISIGIHDDHYKKRHHRRVYRDRHYHNDYHYQYRPHRYRFHYRDRPNYNRYRDKSHRYYRNRYYRDRYYDRRYDRGYDRRVERCPSATFSRYYDRNLDCYRHKDHFHCS